MPAQVPQPGRLLAAHRDIETVQAGQGQAGVRVRMESEGGEVKKEIRYFSIFLIGALYASCIWYLVIYGKTDGELVVPTAVFAILTSVTLTVFFISVIADAWNE